MSLGRNREDWSPLKQKAMRLWGLRRLQQDVSKNFLAHQLSRGRLGTWEALEYYLKNRKDNKPAPPFASDLEAEIDRQLAMLREAPSASLSVEGGLWAAAQEAGIQGGELAREPVTQREEAELRKFSQHVRSRTKPVVYFAAVVDASTTAELLQRMAWWQGVDEAVDVAPIKEIRIKIVPPEPSQRYVRRHDYATLVSNLDKISMLEFKTTNGKGRNGRFPWKRGFPTLRIAEWRGRPVSADREGKPHSCSFVCDGKALVQEWDYAKDNRSQKDQMRVVAGARVIERSKNRSEFDKWATPVIEDLDTGLVWNRSTRGSLLRRIEMIGPCICGLPPCPYSLSAVRRIRET